MNNKIVSAKLKTFPKFSEALKEEVLAAAVYDYVIKNNIKIPADIIKETKNRLAESLKINNEDDLKSYLRKSGLTADQFELFIYKEASLKAVKDIVITDDLVNKYFDEHRNRFKIIYAEKIIVNNIHDAEILISTQVYDSGIYQNKPDEILLRGDLPVDIESRVFNSAAGDIVGPLKEGDHYVIYKIKKIKPAVFDNLTKSKIREGLFSQWLSSLLTSSK